MYCIRGGGISICIYYLSCTIHQIFCHLSPMNFKFHIDWKTQNKKKNLNRATQSQMQWRKKEFWEDRMVLTNVVLVVLFSRSFTSRKLTKRLESTTAEVAFFSKKSFMGSFYGLISTTNFTTWWQFTFYQLVPISSWYPFDRPRKDKRLRQTGSHPVIFNLETLD